jgi:hypothetical protein
MVLGVLEKHLETLITNRSDWSEVEKTDFFASDYKFADLLGEAKKSVELAKPDCCPRGHTHTSYILSRFLDGVDDEDQLEAHKDFHHDLLLREVMAEMRIEIKNTCGASECAAFDEDEYVTKEEYTRRA